MLTASQANSHSKDSSASLLRHRRHIRSNRRLVVLCQHPGMLGDPGFDIRPLVWVVCILALTNFPMV